MNTTKPKRLFLVGVLPLLLAATACGNDPETTETSGQARPAGSGNGELVTTRAVDSVGTVLVDADGNALYTNEAENDGTIKCVEGCADFWPPLEGSESSLPSAVEGIDGEFGVIERPDGTRQVTLDGQPLYTFTEDRTPGTVSGDGFEDDFGGEHFVWHVVTAGTGSQPDNGDNGESNQNNNGGYGY